MAIHPKLHRREGAPPIVFIGVLVAVLALLAWPLFPKKENPYPRQTLVLVGSPMTVLSWNPRDRSLTFITFPEDMTTEGTHGYGTYSFEAFWRLGQIDKKDGTVLAESVSEAIGAPVELFIGPKTGLFPHADDPLSMAKQVFSLTHIPSYLSGAFRTNIPFPMFINFVWLLQITKPDRVTPYDFTHNPGLIADDVTIADGSHQLLLNPDRIDARLAHVFEDEGVRRETVTTAVYNTTDLSSLGTRVARLLANLGVSVVTVGNDAPEVDACTVSGPQSALKSMSAKVIVSVLGCVEKVNSPSDRADMTIRIGASYVKRFAPNP